jgi:hypothetical protein
VAACGEAERATPSPSDTLLTPGGATSVPPAEARHFDAATLDVGDSFLGLRVVDVDVRRAFDDSVWVGRVRFAGDITVAGVYQRHFDWPGPDALCFHVRDDATGAIPAFAPDAWTSPNMKVWFCFTNTNLARELLGSGEKPVDATVVVDDYLVVREFSDVFDTARLVRVEEVRGAAGATLRNP